MLHKRQSIIWPLWQTNLIGRGLFAIHLSTLMNTQKQYCQILNARYIPVIFAFVQIGGEQM